MLTRPERTRIAGMAAVIAGLTVTGWGMLLFLVVPRHLSLGSQTFGAGIGVTAYTLGMRHAFDADHIAAIDNATRRLMSAGRRPLSVGFWFALGHSSVVFALCVLLGLGVRAVATDEHLHRVAGAFGAAISGGFLYLIAGLNAVILVGIVKVFRRLRRGDYDEAELERQLDNRGLANRVFGRVTGGITRPWQLYPVGLLFGLGFDTATEVALLVVAGTSGAAGLPWYAVVCLPVLFAAGMTLFDTIDGSFMNFAYGWALSQPVRKIYYNLVLTALSVTAALAIGTVQLAGLVSEVDIDLNRLGYWLVGLFVLAWLVALLVWRVGRLDDRWRPAVDETSPD
ncbi:HoxN/HupN/NixA family nickel/cobalt transporter [Amycolatopsis cynarae]|uniref:Nickel/cobalt efflux system n=1 Tax=Amycolatopsis cynarae TaxID=2995223 RepID=A0ABY7B020_9PSEU|nr:HoxN/HupN/NixA family nickel/cobalt transporter [Amycolatopsis sp. HUAS 11-8]WAL64618.1 HoxN/HupN/NixA family nickel/cobalt transporter [Amycolatopsis sp. HUAS 11-8]